MDLRPRWSTDPEDEGELLPRAEYQLLLAEYAQREAGAWAAALRRDDAPSAAQHLARLRALAAAGGDSIVEPPTLDAAPRAIRAKRTDGARLFTGATPSLWEGLRDAGASARQVDIVVAYAQPHGVRLIAPWLESVARANARHSVRLLVGTYLNGTSVEALHLLLSLAREVPNVSVRLLADPAVHFHPKIYRVIDGNHRTHVFVGSSNLSFSALTGHTRAGPAVEWNLCLDDTIAYGLVQRACARIDDLFATTGETLSEALIADYDAQRNRALPPAALLEDDPPPLERTVPRPAQTEALQALAQLRAQGYRRALVVAATGLGKTVLAALDALAAAPAGRVLFLAHRESLLTQARDAFARSRPAERCGVVNSQSSELGARHLFVSVASAHRVDPSDFDYIVIDEAHHGAAPSYRALFDRLSPAAFVLGLTATPDRLDGGDIYALFDNVVAYEVSLLDAIGRAWLVPFHYFGLCDTLEFSQRALRDLAPRELEDAVLGEGRMTRVVRALLDPTHAGARTLAFCVSIRHAQQVAARLVVEGLRAAAVHSGPSSLDPAAAIERLRDRTLDVLCVVDMFNEGVDIPELDRVAFLRPTDSPVVFLQQLGRGLRLAPGKTALVVIDFVANHRRSELRPEWLGVSPADVLALPTGTAYAQRFADGRTVSFEPAAVDVLRALSQRHLSLRDRLRDTFDRLRAETPVSPRPSYRELLARSGFAHGTVRTLFGSWSAMLSDRRALTPQDEALAQRPEARTLLDAIETTDMSGPHKMLLLGALAEARHSRITIKDAAALVRGFIARRHPAVMASPTIAHDKLDRPAALQSLLRQMPVKYLLSSAPQCFRFDRASDVFEIVMPPELAPADVFAAIEERTEARLFDFFRLRPSDATEVVGRIVRHQHGALFLNVERHKDRLPPIPNGADGVWIELRRGAERWWAWRVKIAINRLYHAPTEGLPNLITEVLMRVVDADDPKQAAGRPLRLRPIPDAANAFELEPG